MLVNAKGARCERALIAKLTKDGWLAHRIAGSGVGKDAVCDIMAVNGAGELYLIEVKSRKRTYYPRENRKQLDLLKAVAGRYHCVPSLAVKINNRPWVMFDLSCDNPSKVS